MKYTLTSDQIAKFLAIGVRPMEAPKQEIKKDIAGAYFLVPTFKGEWIRENARKTNSQWEGSYIPLIIYKQKRAAILVPHQDLVAYSYDSLNVGIRKVAYWYDLRVKIEEVLKIPVSIVAD